MLCRLSKLLLFATLVWWSARAQEDESLYSFDQYLADFGKTYLRHPEDPHNDKYDQRRRIFDQNLAAIERNNQKNHQH